MRPNLLVVALIPLASAQFGFFEQMFQGHGGQQQQHRPSGASAWAAQSETGKNLDLRYIFIASTGVQPNVHTTPDERSPMLQLPLSKNP